MDKTILDIPKMFQRFIAPRDINGNPRRLCMLYSASGDMCYIIDEGHSGIPKECDGLIELPTVECSAKIYRQSLKDFPKPKK